MTNFLFWNVGTNDLVEQIAVACDENDIDVLIMAEHRGSTISLLHRLNENKQRVYVEVPFNRSSRLTFLTRYPADSFESVSDEGGIAIRRLRPPVGIEILLVALHLPSKLHRSDREQTLYAVRVSKAVREAEARVGHTNSLVIGDLNMNPYEDGMVAADCMHAIMDRRIASQGSRVVDGRERLYFYNPMWNRLGDDAPEPPGTYYRRGQQISHFWHAFDQVLLRPSLLPYYSPSTLRIVTKIGERELLRAGRIDASVSDHLPVFVGLSLEGGI